MKRLLCLGYLVVFAIQMLFPVPVNAQEPEISAQLIQVSKKRINRSVFRFYA